MLHELNLADGVGGTAGQKTYTSKNGVTITSSAPVYNNGSYYYMGYLFDGKFSNSEPATYWLTNGGDTVTLDFDFSAISDKINRFEKITIYPRTRDDTISSYRILAARQKGDDWAEIVPTVTNTYANCPYGTAREHEIKQYYNFIRVELYRSGSFGVTLSEIKFQADVTESYRDTNVGSLYSVPDDGWKRYDDTYAGFKYKFNRPYGSIHYNAEEITFKFYGTKLRLVYNHNQGNNGDVVHIDGIAYPTTKTANGKSTLVFEKSGLPYGLHEVLIKTYTGSEWYSQFDAAEIGSDEYIVLDLGMQLLKPETGWQRCADTQALYPNGYTLYNANGISNMHGGSSRVLTRSSSIGAGNQDKIQFRFFGSKLRLLACTYTDRQETMRIVIDHVDQGTFTSRYNTSNTGQVLVFEKQAMAKGFHDVVITIDAAASSGQFFFDAFDIDEDGYVVGEEGEVIPAPEFGWKRYEDHHPAISYEPGAGWTNANLADHSGGSATGCLTANKEDNKFFFDFIGTRFRLIISKANTYATKIKVSIDGLEAGFFSAYDTYFYHRVAGFQRTNLPRGRHRVEVEVVDKPSNSSGYDYRFDAIDIDADGRLLHADEVLEQKDLEVGKRIRAHYTSRAGDIGYFSSLGVETGDFLPSVQTANPDGDFYLIAVDEDHLGRQILLADRNIQGGISWMKMNDLGFSSGIVLDKQKIPSVPILKSNVSDDGTITVEASSRYGDDYDAWKAFDGLTGSDRYRWIAPHPGPASLTVRYQTPKMIKHYSLLAAFNAAAPTRWQMMGSHDGSDWFLLDERVAQQGLNIEKYFSFDNHTSYRFYRLQVLETNGYGTYFSSVDSLQLYEEDASLSHVLVRLPSGGINSASIDNEWDQYVTRNNFGGKINPGDPRFWNWKGAWTMTGNTSTTNMNYRTVRGSTLGGSSVITTTDISIVNTGFRPLFVMFVANRSENSLISKIDVSYRNELHSNVHIYSNHLEYPESTMTDVTVPVTAADWKGYAFESSGVYNSQHAEWNAFDNSMTSAYPWAAPAGQSTAWLIIDYGSPLKIAGYGIGSRPNYAPQAPRNWMFYGSHDKQNWELLDIKKFQPDWGPGELRKFSLDAEGKSFRYFKWDISNPLTGNQLGVQQFELYGFEYTAAFEQRKANIVVPYKEDLVSGIGVFNENGGSMVPYPDDLTLPMTSNTSNGYTLKASSNYTGSADYNMYQAFNNVAGSGKWSNGTSGGKGWLAIDIVDPAIITSYLLEAPNVNVGDMTKSWTFEGSENGNTWFVLDSRTNEPAWKLNERRVYSITGQVPAYRWFRINSTANVGGGWLTIGEIEIYGLRGGWFNQKKSRLTIPDRGDITGSIFVKPHAKMRVRGNVTPVYVDQILSSVDVKHTRNLVSYISISPHAKMRITGVVNPPPKIEVALSTIKDAFIRSNVPRLNYGEEQEMLVGSTADGENFFSLIQFDTEAIPPGMKLKSARLQIYVEQSNLAGSPVSLHEIVDDWTEVGVTWASMPNYGREIAEMNADASKQRSEIDVLDIVQDWYDKTRHNAGILLKVANNPNHSYVRFTTRERGKEFAPKLIVEYYDPTVKSSGYADVINNVTVRQNKYKDLLTKITIKSYWSNDDFPGSIRIYNPDMMESFLTTIRNNLLSKITVRRSHVHGIPSQIVVSNKRDSVLETNLQVSRDFLQGHVTVRRSDINEIQSQLNVRRADESPLISAIDVSRTSLVAAIEVASSSMIPTVITVIRQDDRSLEGLLTVRRNDAYDFRTRIDTWTKNEMDGSIIVKSGYLASSIIIPHTASKDVISKIKIAERFASDLTSFIFIGHESVLLSTIVVEFMDDGFAFIM